jgi:Na+-driven multidrug efflux pump
MLGEDNVGMTEVYQPGLSQAEARELQAHLDTEEWTGLLAVQHAFANAPMLPPSTGFSDRVLQGLSVRERERARRRSATGVIAFALGSVTFITLVFWLSPLEVLTQANGWAELLNTLTSLVGVSAVLLEIAGTFAQVLTGFLNVWIVLALGLFSLLLTLLWTRVVVGWTPLNRPEPV